MVNPHVEGASCHITALLAVCQQLCMVGVYLCLCCWPPAGPKKKEDDCIPDKIFMFLCLSICLNAVVLGLHQVIVIGKFTAWLALPMLWAINNAGERHPS